MQVRPGAIGPWHTLTTFAAVMLATTVTLAALNAVPDWLGNDPKRVRTAATLSAAEARLGQGVWLPAFYPQWLAWPPSRVRFVAGPPSIVAIDLGARETREPVLLFVQASTVDAAIPAQLLAAVTRVEEASERVSGNRATVATVRLPDGSRWRELAWSDGDARFVMRYRGHDADVLRMARSLRKERP